MSENYRKFIPKVALFAYEFSHWKSENLLESCILNKISVPVVFAAPMYDLSTKKIVDFEPSAKLEYLCNENNIKLIKCSHDNIANIKNISKNEKCNLGLIGGARKIKSEVISVFEFGILNYHPGKLPDTAGLNAIERSILNELPITVSFHIINEKLDDGLMLLEQVVPIKIDDTLLDLKKRNLEFQIYLNPTIIKLYSESRLSSYPINRSLYNKKMTNSELKLAQENIEKWKRKILNLNH